jgi:hypothetical protein
MPALAIPVPSGKRESLPAHPISHGCCHTDQGEKSMTVHNERGSQDEFVVGYFSDGSDAYRAIGELIDEGFSASEIGAAFRTPRGAASSAENATVGEIRGIRELTEKNPAVSGTVGGPASGDQAVTPAGLAPGSGNAFPGAPSTPGPIPGAEIPQTLPHDLPETLPHDLPATRRQSEGRVAGFRTADNSWVDHLKRTYGASNTTETARNRNSVHASDQEFGTGEGTLGLTPEYEYSEANFEGSFVGMGLASEHARSLSGELSRGGAVVSIGAGERASLAEAIMERNHGRVRFENAAVFARADDRESSVRIYGSMRDYYRSDEDQRRKAS